MPKLSQIELLLNKDMKAAQEHFLEHFGLKEWTEEDKARWQYSYLQMIKFAESFANAKLQEAADKKKSLGLIRYDKEKPPKNKTVLFVYWHRNGIDTSQMCCGFITDSGKLITDLKFHGSDNPTFWKELF